MEESIVVRKMQISDVDFIFDIGKNVEEFKVDSKFEGFWSKKQLKDWIESKDEVLMVVEANNSIIGFIMFSVHLPTKKAVLENIWTSEKVRGKGVASILHSHAVDELRNKKITYLCSLVKKNANSSIKFHKGNGFQKGFDFSWFHKLI